MIPITSPRRAAGNSSAATTMQVAYSPSKKMRATICSPPNTQTFGEKPVKNVNSV
jgi:hypothetical protein